MTSFSSSPLALREVDSDIHRSWYGHRVSPIETHTGNVMYIGKYYLHEEYCLHRTSIARATGTVSRLCKQYSPM
jgi:hypothetical protein